MSRYWIDLHAVAYVIKRNALQSRKHKTENPVSDSFLHTKKDPYQSKPKRVFPHLDDLISSRQRGLAGTRKSARLSTISIQGSAYAAKASYVLASRAGGQTSSKLTGPCVPSADWLRWLVRRPVEIPSRHHSGTGANPRRRA